MIVIGSYELGYVYLGRHRDPPGVGSSEIGSSMRSSPWRWRDGSEAIPIIPCW